MTEPISNQPVSDEELKEMIEADRLLRYKEEDLTKPQLHRRRLLAEVQRLREQNRELSDKEA